MIKSKFYTNVNQSSGKILYRGLVVMDDGTVHRMVEQLDYKPRLWLKTDKETEWKTIKGTSLAPIEFDSIWDCRKFIKEHEQSGVEIFGNQRFQYTFIHDKNPDGIKEWMFELLRIWNIDIEVASDRGFPEPELADQEVNAITLDDMNTGKTITWGYDKYKTIQKYESEDPEVTFIECKDEIELLTSFFDYWVQNYPDIVTGWNVKKFDIMYIYNRIVRLFGEEKANKLSPWGSVWVRRRFNPDFNKEEVTIDLTGISQIDYMEAYKKFAPNGKSQESYTLGHIGTVELGMDKLDYTEEGSLHGLYKTDFQKYIDYNIRDTRIVRGLEEKLKLLELVVTLAYSAMVNYDDVFMQVRMWDSITTKDLADKKIVVPPLVEHEKKEKYQGAYVMEPMVGKHKWPVGWDLDSLYPHLIMMFNISPEMIVEPSQYNEEMRKFVSENDISVESMLAGKLDLSILDKYGMTLAPNGHFFLTRKEGFLPEIMRRLYDDRKEYKNKMIEEKKIIEELKHSGNNDPEKEKVHYNLAARYENTQLAKKVTLNSAYGAMGNQYFRFFDVRVASAITLAGQLVIKWVIKDINDFLNRALKTENRNYILAADTDSMYIKLEELVNQYRAKVNPDATDAEVVDVIDNYCKEVLSKKIAESFDRLSQYVRPFRNAMHMKREKICDVAIWTAKKRYILSVWDNEGVRYDSPKISISGLEAIKSSTPAHCRDMIKKGIEIIIRGTNEDLYHFIEDYRDIFHEIPLDEIGKPTSVKGIEKYIDPEIRFKKGTPKHSKAAIVFNQYLEAKGLTKKYETIKPGEKMKWVALKKPNPLDADTMGFKTILPPEFELDEFIDYREQFQKAFVEPMNIVLQSIGWTNELYSNIDDLLE